MFPFFLLDKTINRIYIYICTVCRKKPILTPGQFYFLPILSYTSYSSTCIFNDGHFLLDRNDDGGERTWGDGSHDTGQHVDSQFQDHYRFAWRHHAYPIGHGLGPKFRHLFQRFLIHLCHRRRHPFLPKVRQLSNRSSRKTATLLRRWRRWCRRRGHFSRRHVRSDGSGGRNGRRRNGRHHSVNSVARRRPRRRSSIAQLLIPTAIARLGRFHIGISILRRRRWRRRRRR